MDTILAPTDFSAAATNAVHYAASLAGYFNARLVLVHAYQVPAVNYETAIPADILVTLQKSGEEALQKLRHEILDKHPGLNGISCVVDMGYTYDVIANTADAHKADMVVMGLVGEAGTFKEHVIGSTSLKVARELKIPVWIIPEGTGYHRIRKIAFACDMHHTEETMLAYVVKYFSRMFDAEMEVLHVEKNGHTLEIHNAGRYLDQALHSIPHHMIYLEGKDTAEVLRNHLTLHPADLLIMNPQHHSVFHNMVSLTRKMAFHAGLPILAIH